MTINERPFGLEGAAYYAVFDGHAGIQASQYCRENLKRELSSSLFSEESVGEQLKKGKSIFKL